MVDSDTLAARMRAEYVGEDAIAFDELKPEVRARWERVAAVAKTKPPVTREAIARALEVPGVPSVEELAEVLHKALPHMPPATYRERNEAMATAVLAALRPWLREPTGWELDVEPEVTYEAGSSGIYFAEQCDIDWLCSRIRPTFDPCKRCAKLSEYRKIVLDGAEEVRNRIDAARATLEGE